MELKSYQKKVIADLTRYLELLNETQNYMTAFEQFWREKSAPALGRYQNVIPGVPNLCFKVPTGGGKTFIAIPSTTPKGESKIKALLTPGAGVVTTRHMVQHIVTEYGVAHLRGRNLAQRARALIAVAHPSVREKLEKAACERFGYSFLRLR